MNISWYDVGAHTTERSDYPDYAQKAVALMHTHTVSLSVLLCGTGAGMAMAANRFSKIYAAVAWNSEIAKKAREEDNCNCLVLPADYLTHDEACAIVSAWLAASFRGGHYAERLARID